jgi:hypothetical protein
MNIRKIIMTITVPGKQQLGPESVSVGSTIKWPPESGSGSIILNYWSESLLYLFDYIFFCFHKITREDADQSRFVIQIYGCPYPDPKEKNYGSKTLLGADILFVASSFIAEGE